MSMRELDDAILRLRGLVLVRGILEQRGASAPEIEEHGAEIERAREQLHQLVERDVHGAAA
jgi:hypothetical protein